MSITATSYAPSHIRSTPIFFFKDPATPDIYTLSLHDALPICAAQAYPDRAVRAGALCVLGIIRVRPDLQAAGRPAFRRLTDRKSTRLNSSHPSISYAVFCLKKKKTKNQMGAALRRHVGYGLWD